MSGEAWGAAAAAAMNLLEGHLGREQTQDTNLANYNAQKEFAQSGIQWKVIDAKKAGLHPLFALGGGGASFSPSFQVNADQGISSAGQNLSRAAAAADPTQRSLVLAQLEAVKAATEKDYAQASAYAAEAAKTRQGFSQSLPVGDPSVAQVIPLAGMGPSGIQGGVDTSVSFGGGPYQTTNPWVNPPATPPYLVSNNATPGFQKFTVPGIGELILPAASSLSESLESLENPVLQAAIVAANAAHYKDMSKLKRLFRSRGWSDPWGALNDFSMGR